MKPEPQVFVFKALTPPPPMAVQVEIAGGKD